MALENFVTDDYSSFFWYREAFNKKISNYSEITSVEFGKGVDNTKNMILVWNDPETYGYGEQNKKDLWGAIQDKVKEGWFVPSRGEWGAFCYNLGITSSTYSKYELSNAYLSSSLRNTTRAWGTNIGKNFMDGGSVFRIEIDYWVRLSKTF